MISFFSCSHRDSPEQVASGYLKALYNQDISKIGDFVSDEEAIKETKLIESLPQDKAEVLKNSKYDVISQKIIGETAFVKFLINSKLVTNDTLTVKLTKIEKQWKVTGTQY